MQFALRCSFHAWTEIANAVEVIAELVEKYST